MKASFSNLIPKVRVPSATVVALVLAALALAIPLVVFASSAPQAHLWDCSNGVSGAVGDCEGLSTSQHTNGWNFTGNMNEQNSSWQEDMTVPWRVTMQQLPRGVTVTMTIRWSFVNGAFTWDYPKVWNSSITAGTSGPCDWPTNAGWSLAGAANCVSSTTRGFPTNPLFVDGTCPPSPPGAAHLVVPAANMLGFGGITITNISYVSPPPSCIYDKPASDDSIQVQFTTPTDCTWNGDAMLLWGLHIANQLDWGGGRTASSLGSGGTASPYHSALVSWTFSPPNYPTCGDTGPIAINGIDTNEMQMKVVFIPTAVKLSQFLGLPGTDSGAILKWTTASEVNTAGFNIYRSEHSDGPFTRINAALIPASKDAVAGHEYTYRDAGATPGRQYYYQLEDVDLNGAAVRHGTVTIVPNGLAPQVGQVMLAGLGLSALLLAVGGVVLARLFRHA